ncbi:MAG: glycerate kinase [Gemmobacter sp.]
MDQETGGLRAEALALFRAGVAAADPHAAVIRALRDLPPPAGRQVVVGVGKAALRMTEAALRVLGPVRALVVTNHENARPLDGATVFAAGHPVPDAAGARAAEAVIAAVSALGAGDRLLALISGGGSALLPAPAPGIALEEKAEVSRLLLASGADIVEMNLVRQNLSRLKGGGMARLAAPADVVALVLSDVVGDDLSVIASGPTVPPAGSPQAAAETLRRLGLWNRVPASVRRHLETAAAAPDVPPTDTRLIGSNTLSLAAMSAMAPAAQVCPCPLVGDVAAAAAQIVATARGPGVWLWGGETTVTLRGDGTGGRNQELALRVAVLARAAGWRGDWVFLSGGTDGRDGPTDAAGGLVDGGTLARMRAAGIDPEARLERNDSYRALAAAGDLLKIGATGTNVADLQVLIRR